MSLPIGVILNPRSRKNRSAPEARAERLRALLGELGEVRVTASLDELERALAELRGVKVLVTDGGDGALHCALNGLLESGIEAEELPAFLPTNGGTIDFVAKKAGIRGDGGELISALVARLRRGEALSTSALDTLLIEGEGEGDGNEPSFRRVGFAAAIGGVGQRFFDKYYAEARPSAGTIPRVMAKTLAGVALGALPRVEPPRELREHAEHLFRPTLARVSIDGEVLEAESHRALHAGAFDVDLGGFIRLFPLAAAPGALHFTAGWVSVGEALYNLPALVGGGALRGRRVRDAAGRRMEVEALGEERLWPVIDGERYGGLRRMLLRRGPNVRIVCP